MFDFIRMNDIELVRDANIKSIIPNPLCGDCYQQIESYDTQANMNEV